MKLNQEVRNGQIVPVSIEIENEKEVEFLLDQLRPKGKWNYKPNWNLVHKVRVCNKCGFSEVVMGNDEKRNFCPNCGADMREGDKS